MTLQDRPSSSSAAQSRGLSAYVGSTQNHRQAFGPDEYLARSVVGHAGPRGPVAALHGLLLMLVLPFAVLWIPLVNAPGLGNLTILDCLMVLLWFTTLLEFGPRWHKSCNEKRALRIVVYACAPALLGCIGALAFDSQSRLTTDVLQHAKRFGLPAILPLALLMAAGRYLPRVRAMAVASVAIMVLIPFTPMAALLPIGDVRNGDLAKARGVGSLSNPNEFGYIGLLGAMIGASHVAGERCKRLRRRWWASAALVLGLAAVVMSGSRSAMAAALAAAVYLVFHSQSSVAKKLSVAAILIAAMIVGWLGSPVYQDRMAMTVEQRIQDPNIFARIEAQSIAFRTWLHHPLGVGFSNLPAATAEFSQNAQSFTALEGSDSIYFDFLAATGALGVLCVILCFRNCWKLAEFRRLPVEATYLKAGMVAAFVFGLAAVAPASYCVAPFFFSTAGLTGCLRREYSIKEVRRA